MRSSVVVLLCAGFVAQTLAQEHPSPRRGYEGTKLTGEKASLRFHRWGEGILLDNVFVNSKGPYRFMLDTGAEGGGRVDKALAEELNLPIVGETQSVGLLGESRAMTRRKLESLTIGGLSFSNLELSSRDYSQDQPRSLRPIHGILGFHLFNEYLLTIDYPARTITVARGELPAPNGRDILPFVSDDEDPEIEISLGGKTIQALLDTGAMGPLGVPATLAEELKFTSEPRARGRDGDVELRSATLDGALKLGALEVPNPDLIIAGRMPMPVVGISILSKFALTFDQKNDRVRIVQPPARKRYGLVIATPADGPPAIREIESDSVAARAGLLATDKLAMLNGRAVTEMDREDVLRALDAPGVTVVVERDGERKEVRLALE